MLLINTGGAAGDIRMAVVLLRSPRWLHVEDVGLSIVAWAPPSQAATAAELTVPDSIGILTSGLDSAAIEAGRRRARGEHDGRRWPEMIAWWVVITLMSMPFVVVLTQMVRYSIPDLKVGPLHVSLGPSPEAPRRLSTSYEYPLGLAALWGVIGALPVLLVAAVRALWPRAS